jgi:hypothetical protein
MKREILSSHISKWNSTTANSYFCETSFFFFFVCRKMEERNKAWVVGASGEVASVERQNWRSWCGVPAVERAKQR